MPRLQSNSLNRPKPDFQQRFSTPIPGHRPGICHSVLFPRCLKKSTATPQEAQELDPTVAPCHVEPILGMIRGYDSFGSGVQSRQFKFRAATFETR